MPAFYQLQSELEKLKKKSGLNQRLSDLRKVVYGGRGGNSDQIAYLHKNISPVPIKGVEEKLSDSWIDFVDNNTTGVTTKRFKESRTMYFVCSTLP